MHFLCGWKVHHVQFAQDVSLHQRVHVLPILVVFLVLLRLWRLPDAFHLRSRRIRTHSE
jgi:hypothetical protein